MEEKHRSNLGKKELPWKFELIFWAKMSIAVYLLWARHGQLCLLVFPKDLQREGITTPYSPAQAPFRLASIRINISRVLAWRPPRSIGWTVSLGVTHAGLWLHSQPLHQWASTFVNAGRASPQKSVLFLHFISPPGIHLWFGDQIAR